MKSYHGGTLHEIKTSVAERISKKDKIARNRLNLSKYGIIELCICVEDGGLIDDMTLAEYLPKIIQSVIFDKIFIITSCLLLVYNNKGLEVCINRINPRKGEIQ